MARILKILVAVSFGVVLGGMSIVVTLRGGSLGEGGVQNGPWNANLAVGGADADIYTRASVALGGLLALSKEETIYYTAFTDNEGLTLSENCTYEVSGQDPATRWWSITAYAADHYLPLNDDGRLSMAQSTVARASDGSFTIVVSPDPEDVNWISSRGAGKFSLTLRLYNPERAVYEAPATTTLPTITRRTCR